MEGGSWVTATSALASSLSLPEFVSSVSSVKDEEWKHLRDATTGNTVLHVAAAARRTDVLRWLLEPPRAVAVNALNKQVCGHEADWARGGVVSPLPGSPTLLAVVDVAS
jgi:hypothetical protein